MLEKHNLLRNTLGSTSQHHQHLTHMVYQCGISMNERKLNAMGHLRCCVSLPPVRTAFQEKNLSRKLLASFVWTNINNLTFEVRHHRFFYL